MHEPVGKYWGYCRPLRASSHRLHQFAVGVLQRGSKPPMNIQHHPWLIGMSAHRTDHQIPRHGIEERLDTKMITQSYFQHRFRNTSIASKAERAGR